ncbi:MAG: glycosyltransferase, partial [Planctomycetota bacterium]|nr:glycosyltransferase [Planctomycetota bacterium]
MDRMSAIGSGASPGAAYLGEPPTVLFLGQLVERKGLHILVQAFERMHERAHLFLVGGNWDEGDYPATIRQLALAGRSGARVHLPNHRQD